MLINKALGLYKRDLNLDQSLVDGKDPKSKINLM